MSFRIPFLPYDHYQTGGRLSALTQTVRPTHRLVQGSSQRAAEKDELTVGLAFKPNIQTTCYHLWKSSFTIQPTDPLYWLLRVSHGCTTTQPHFAFHKQSLGVSGRFVHRYLNLETEFLRGSSDPPYSPSTGTAPHPPD